MSIESLHISDRDKLWIQHEFLFYSSVNALQDWLSVILTAKNFVYEYSSFMH